MPNRHRAFKTAIILAAALALTACAGRAPAPVNVVQAQDRLMDCPAIAIETEANTKQIAALGKDEGAKTAQNVAAGVAGLFIWPLWFAMDFQGAAPKEIAALQSRNQYLAVMSEQKQCALAGGSSTTAPQAAPVVVGRDDYRKGN
jgi:hypothetical protein